VSAICPDINCEKALRQFKSRIDSTSQLSALANSRSLSGCLPLERVESSSSKSVERTRKSAHQHQHFFRAVNDNYQEIIKKNLKNQAYHKSDKFFEKSRIPIFFIKS
jgi:hypothetical protein